MSKRPGPTLPYNVIASATPYGSQWLVASAKTQSATFAPEPPKVYPSFLEILSERPAFSIVLLNASIGWMDDPSKGGRTCDNRARKMLGRRGSAVHNAPTRLSFKEGTTWAEGNLDAATGVLMARYREVLDEMASYHQRVVYEGQPELSFYQLNGERPLRWSKNTQEGQAERRALLEGALPGVEKIVDCDLGGTSPAHLLDLAALLWSARRISGHSAVRLPAEAEWDSEGLRQEFVY